MKINNIPAILALAIMTFVIGPEARPAVLALVGDIMLGRSIGAEIEKDGTDLVFWGLSPWLHSADLAFGNLESPLGRDLPENPDPYNLCAKAGAARVLKTAGFDLLSTANNHSRDCLPADGDAGEQDPETVTADLLAVAGMRAVKDGYLPVEIVAGGQRLAFLAADDVSAAVDLPRLTNAVKTARASGAAVIVSMHWGAEYQAGPSARQKRIAAELAAAGARLIVGHHPHVEQTIECIQGASEDESTLVFYSLGNALFDQHGLPDTRRGLLAFIYMNNEGPIRYGTMSFLIQKSAGSFTQPAQDIQIHFCPDEIGK